MKTIYDPANRWLSAPPLVLSAGNKLPVASADALTVLIDGGPVSVDVLSNDYDPEGAPLTLVSASAALGTAVAEADNTVTYTPPPGISGFDTVVYVIADDLGQQRSGQIDVTIVEPQLSIDLAPDNTLVVNALTGAIDITVTEPQEFAGTYQAATADLAGGPVNLVPPSFTGNLAEGQVLSAEGGLWIHGTDVTPVVRSWQWLRSGGDIGGATASTYSMTAADIGQGISVRETLTDGAGQRSAESVALGAAFTPADDAQLVGWWDAADPATITAGGTAVTTWADKAGGNSLLGTSDPQTGTRTLNGLNVIDFDGSAYFEAARTMPASGNVAFHMALVIDSVNNAFGAVLAVEAGNDFQIDANNAGQFDGRLNAVGIGAPVGFSGGPYAGALILSVVFDLTGTAQAEIFVADASRGVTGYTTAIDASVMLHLMTNRTKNAWIDGAVAELIVTGDITNRADHHGYLASKWGLI